MKKDGELKTDEYVIKNLNRKDQLYYGKVILNVLTSASRNKNLIGTSFIFGGEKYMKRRIVNIANYKKPARISFFVGTMLSLIICSSCLTDSIDLNNAKTDSTRIEKTEQTTAANLTQTTNEIALQTSTQTADANLTQTTGNATNSVKPYDDIRYFPGSGTYEKQVYYENEYNKNDIITYTFNQGTILKGNEELQAQIMENGKNPGLGIRGLHDKGITGKGVNVAIIDQNLLLDHPEFAGKIAAYYDTGCEQDENSGSMHAPAVTSILVGNTIGVAPDARVYFAAAPSWKTDSEFYAKGLNWIIEENKKLPDDEKIRVVSVSAAPSGAGSPFTKNQYMWNEAVLAAQKEGILVLDTNSIIYPAYYDPTDPDDVSKCKGGFLTRPFKVLTSYIGVPCCYRTVAEEYHKGEFSYQYTGQGGLSWGIPYAASVLALGWQVNPALNKDKIVQILFDTCTIANDGSNLINPVAFIDAVEKTK